MKCILLIIVILILAGCSDARDTYQAVISEEAAQAADDLNETVKWGYCYPVSLGSMWRECTFDLNSSCWQNRAAVCAGVPINDAPPIQLQN